MRFALLVLALAGHAQAAEFVVTNRIPAFEVVNRMPPTVKQSLTAQTATKKTVVHQASASHTHACPNPNCSFRKEFGEPFVWSHSQVAGHQCPHCGSQQIYVSNRPVTVVRTVQVPVSTPPVVQAAPAQPVFVLPTKYSSNCASGNCQMPTVSYRR